MTSPKLNEKIEKAEKAFEAWQRENPGKSFHDYYVDIVSAQLDAGRPHATLGKNIKGDEAFEDSGRAPLNFMVEQGLRPEHVFVDYGCGSLRVGQHFMRYLEPGRFWGLDITDRFYRDGVEMLGRQFIADHRPNLRVIDDASLAEARAARPDFIISTAVIIHVPPEELDGFLDRLMTIVTDNTRAFVVSKTADETVRYSGRSWAHGESRLLDGVAARGGRAELVVRSTIDHEETGTTFRRGLLVIER